MAHKVAVTTLSSRIGARLDGERLGGDLDEATVDEIHQPLPTHQVISFGGQRRLIHRLTLLGDAPVSAERRR